MQPMPQRWQGQVNSIRSSQYIDAAAVTTAAQNCALQNKSFDVSQLNASVEIGKWNFATQTFTPVPSPTYTTDVNAVRTTVKRLGDDGSGSVNPKMGTYFATILGYNNLGTQATAVAYLGITGSSFPGYSLCTTGQFHTSGTQA